MDVDDFFQRLIAALERSGVPYMVTGSYASSAHGTPRATNDIDIVIAPSLDQLRGLIRELPDDRYYADEVDAVEALKHESQFNVIDFATTWKADLIFRKHREFSTQEFARRRTHTIAGVEVRLATAEDILLAKLEWYKQGESARQLEDVVGIIRRQGTSLDRGYVEYWVSQLGVEEQWREALAAAG
ncbi:MAG TPA: hypothetical protein VE974_29805 [Thermoanaerobaculia bacterium]|nr:hypothetical protein [Thermoanaerobaculia bacterium]